MLTNYDQMSNILRGPEQMKLYFVQEHITGLDCVRLCSPALEEPSGIVKPKWVKTADPDLYNDELFILDLLLMLINIDDAPVIYDSKRDKLIQQWLIPGEPYPFVGWTDTDETEGNTMTRYKIIYQAPGSNTRRRAFKWVNIRPIHPLELLGLVQSLIPAHLVKGKILRGIEDIDSKVTHFSF